MSDNSTSTHTTGDPDHQFAPPPPPSNTDYRHARWPRNDFRLRISDFGLSSTTDSNPKSGALHAIQNPKWNDPRHIVVVGVCSAGKSTLASRLREKGYRARTVAQEHSYVPRLWQLSRPDVLIYLDASLPTIRRRRKARWPQSMLDEEHGRLSMAREHCDLYIHTDGLLPEDVTSRVLTFLNNNRPIISDQ